MIFSWDTDIIHTDQVKPAQNFCLHLWQFLCHELDIVADGADGVI